MTNREAKPLFTAEDGHFYPGQTSDSKVWLTIHEANAKVAPLQEALSEMRLKCGEWANKVASQHAELERLRAHLADVTREWEMADEETRQLEADNEKLRARVAELEKKEMLLQGAGQNLTADNARMREALELIAKTKYLGGSVPNKVNEIARAVLPAKDAS